MSYGQFLFPPYSSLLKLECLLNWGLHLRRYKGREKDGNHFIWNTHSWTALEYSFLCLPYTLPLPVNQASHQCAQLCMCVLKRWRVNYIKSDGDCCSYVRTCGLDVLHCVYAPFWWKCMLHQNLHPHPFPRIILLLQCWQVLTPSFTKE